MCFNFAYDISSILIGNFSVQNDYSKKTPLTFDTIPLSYNILFKDRTSDKKLNSTFIKTQETLTGTRNLTHQDIQTLSHFIDKNSIKKHKTKQQTVFPIHTSLTTPHNKKSPFPQTALQSTLNLSIGPK